MKILRIGSSIEEVREEDIDLSGSVLYWFHISPNELKRISTSYFNFQEDTIEECENKSQFAKVDFYEEYTFLVLNSLKYEKGTVYPDEFNIYLTRSCVITVSKKECTIISQLQQLLIGDAGVFLLKDKNPARLLYCILDKLVQSDYEIINKLENAADTLEIHIIKKPDKQFLSALIHLRHQVHTLRRGITPLRYIGDNLMCNDNSIIDKDQIKYLKQINVKIDKLMFSMESLVQYIVLVREAFETEMANKTNDFMKLFTAVSLFFGSLTLIMEMFGMFFVCPQYNMQYGFIGMMGLLVLISAAMFIFFKKKEWF
jgi:magnesium transporter